MIYAGLDGIPIVRGSLVVPAWGIWHADVYLDRGDALSGKVTLQLADITAQGTIVRGISFLGQSGYRVVGGAAGWQTDIAARQYANPVALTLSTVLTDTAATIGETVVIPSDRTIGTAYVRQAGRASLVLQQLAQGAWYVDYDGKTYAQARQAGTVTSQWSVIDATQPSTAYVVATEYPGDWLPGRAFKSEAIAGTINRVRHVIAPGKLRTEVLADV